MRELSRTEQRLINSLDGVLNFMPEIEALSTEERTRLNLFWATAEFVSAAIQDESYSTKIRYAINVYCSQPFNPSVKPNPYHYESFLILLESIMMINYDSLLQLCGASIIGQLRHSIAEVKNELAHVKAETIRAERELKRTKLTNFLVNHGDHIALGVIGAGGLAGLGLLVGFARQRWPLRRLT